MTRLPRILQAVPNTLHTHLEIAKAIQTLAAPEEKQQLSSSIGTAASEIDPELIKRCAHKISQDILWFIRSNFRGGRLVKAAVDDPKHPGWPAGAPDSQGGQFRPKGEQAWASAGDPPGIGHNQGPPLEEPPPIPSRPPATTQALNAFIKAAAYWLAGAGKAVAARFLARLRTLVWLVQALPLIYTYLDSPKTLEELQQDALNPRPGYNIHHIVEKRSAKDDGFPDSMIDAPDNLVRIPTLRHWQITTWFQTKNDKFGGLSPREYLRGKNWSERERIGKEALVLFRVLKP